MSQKYKMAFPAFHSWFLPETELQRQFPKHPLGAVAPNQLPLPRTYILSLSIDIFEPLFYAENYLRCRGQAEREDMVPALLEANNLVRETVK